MSQPGPLIHHVSDTALWAAIHRAKESERPDAQFRDPFARRLAGERGEQIAAGLAISEADSWSWMARTCLFDNLIAEAVQSGALMVVNLGAGLDTRPYRMEWPDALTWVEIDLPGILDYKAEVLAADQPRCRLERIPLDLADIEARRARFRSLGDRAQNILVLTEGVLTYLTAEDVQKLAEDLAAVPAFRGWILDLASPGLLRMLRQRTQSQFGDGAPPLQVAPDNGPEFFAPYGWRAVDVQSLLQTAARLGRLPAAMQPLALLPEDPVRMGQQPWSGVCRLVRT